eukprot:UN09883
MNYFKDPWNNFDGTIVVISVIELAILSAASLSALRALRMFRVLRVLRVLGKVEKSTSVARNTYQCNYRSCVSDGCACYFHIYVWYPRCIFIR